MVFYAIFSSKNRYNSCYVKFKLTNGYICESNTYATHIVGIPYTMNVSANDSWSAWSGSGNIAWGNGDRGTALRLGSALGSSFNTGTSSVTKTFDKIPEDVKVVVKSKGEARGSNFIFDISTTYNLYVSGVSAGSATAKGNNKYTTFDIDKVMTLTKANPTIQHNNSN